MEPWTATLAPASASAMAMAAPRPRDDPVTSAVLPFRLNFSRIRGICPFRLGRMVRAAASLSMIKDGDIGESLGAGFRTLGLTLSQVPESGSPPHGRRPVRGAPDLGHPQ